MAKDLGLNAVVSAKDNASKTIQGVGKSADSLSKKFETVGKKFNDVGKKFTTRVSLPIVAGFGFAIKSAVDFEDSFAGIRKTVDASEAEFGQLSENIRNLSKTTPVAVNDLNRVGELAGQLGVRGVDNLTKFIDTIAKIAVTTNLTEEEAATSFARIANIMQEPIQNVDRMGSSVVDLGNNFATTESEIVNFANRIAGAGKTAGLTTADIFGISTAFSSVGVEAERGGTAVSKTLFSMANAVNSGNENLAKFASVAGMTVSNFKTLFEKDAVGAFDVFVQGLGKNGIKATGLLEDLELSDARLMQSFISVAGAGGIMSKAIDKAGKAFGENTALTDEANKKYATTASKLKIAKNNLNDLMITVGTELIPVLTPFLEKIVSIIQSFQKLSPATKDIIYKLGAILVVVGPLLSIFGRLILITNTLRTAMLGFTIASTAMKLGVVGLGVAVTALAVYGIAKLIQGTKQSSTAITYHSLTMQAMGQTTAVLKKKQQEYTQTMGSLKTMQQRTKESQDRLTEATRIYGSKSDQAKKASQQHKDTLAQLKKAQEAAEWKALDLAIAQQKVAAATQRAKDAGIRYKDILGGLAVDMGSTALSADQLARAIRGIQSKTVHIDVIKRGFTSGGLEAVGGNATGTEFWRGGSTWVGEQGPELVTLPRGSKVTPNNSIKNSGSSDKINISINVGAFMGSQQDARKFASFLEKALMDAKQARGSFA